MLARLRESEESLSPRPRWPGLAPQRSSPAGLLPWRPTNQRPRRRARGRRSRRARGRCLGSGAPSSCSAIVRITPLWTTSSAPRAPRRSMRAKPRADALAEDGARLAARVLEARARAPASRGRAPGSAACDLVDAQALPAPEVDLAELGDELHRRARAPPARRSARSGAGGSPPRGRRLPGASARAAARICSRPSSESEQVAAPCRRSREFPTVSP